MQKLSFTKMHGCGNDYIYFDCFHQTIPDPAGLSIRLSQPHFGIGADGIILIGPSAKADAEMRIFNKDGSEGNMCGNGIRCVGKYLYDSGLARKGQLTVDTKSGVKTLLIHPDGNGEAAEITVDMGPARTACESIPVLLPGPSVIGREHVFGQTPYRITCISMGNPHCVVFCDDISQLPLEQIGPLFEHDPIFPEQVNTEFVEVLSPTELRMRVWERGSGETMACGTGACASVAAAVLCGHCEAGKEIVVHLLGGSLKIVYTANNVTMTGGAATVFTGEVIA